MPFDASGQFGYSPDTELPAVPNTVIKSAPYNALAAEIAAALGLTFLRDGSVAATGDFDLDGNTIQKLGLVYDRLAAARQSQVQVVQQALAAGEVGLLKDSSVWKVNHTASNVSGLPASAPTEGLLTIVALPDDEVLQTYITDGQDYERTYDGTSWGDWTVIDYTAGFTITDWNMTAPAGSTTAALPEGAKDGQMYRVTAGGVFGGLTTEVGDYYLLYGGMAKLLPLYQVTPRLTVGVWNPVTSTQRNQATAYPYGESTSYASPPAGKKGGTIGFTVAAGVPVADSVGSYRYTGFRVANGGADSYFANVGQLRVDQLKIKSLAGNHNYGTAVIIVNDNAVNVSSIIAEVLTNSPTGSYVYTAFIYAYTGTTSSVSQYLYGLCSDGAGTSSTLFPATAPSTPNGQLQLTLAANTVTVDGVGSSFSMPNGVASFYPVQQGSSKEIYVLLYSLEPNGSALLDDYRFTLETDVGVDTVVSGATKPADAVDGKVYRITGAGTYDGIELFVNDYVQFYNNTDDFIITRLGDGTLAGTITAHIANTSNPHSVTKTQVGLGNVDNTADADKPVSTAQQTALDGKLTDIQSPAATGETLVMTKSTVYARLKKLIASGDISISSAVDLITIGLTGSTLKLWQELSANLGGRYSRTFRAKRQDNENAGLPVNVYLAGAYATNQPTTISSYYYSVSLADPNGHNGTGYLGYGAIDLQIRRDNTSSTPSGDYSVALGHRNSVTGSNSVCISANANVDKAVSSNDSYFMGTSATITGTGGSNYLIGSGIIGGSSGNNYVFGSAGLYGSASRNYIIGTMTGTASGYSVLGDTVGLFSAEQNIILSSVGTIYGNITDRNMKGVLVTCTSRKLNSNTYPRQTVTIGVTNSASNAQNQTWVTMTTNDPLGLQSPSTTNVYKLPHTGQGNAVAFCGYVSVYGAVGHRLMKIEGSVYSNVVTFSKVHLGGTTSDDAVIDARVIESSGYLYIEFKGDIAAGNSLYGSAIFDFFELF